MKPLINQFFEAETSDSFQKDEDFINKSSSLILYIVCGFLLIISLFFLPIQFRNHNTSLLVINLLQLICSLIIIFTTIKTNKTHIQSIILANIYILFIFYLLLTNGEYFSILFWIYLFPLLSFFLLHLRIAIIMTSVLFTGSIIILFSPYCPLRLHQYETLPAVRFMFSFTIVSISTFLYEHLRQLSNKKLEGQIFNTKQLAIHLIEAKEHAEMLFNFVPSAILTVDISNTITSLNKKAEEITGYSEIEMLLKKCTFWIDENIDSNSELSENKISFRDKECQLKCKDGTIKTVLKSNAILTNEQKIPIGRIESFYDISAKKKTEDELVTAKIAAEAATKKAIEAARTKSSFLANMSHEIRTPMNGIIGMTSLIIETDLNEEQKEYAKNIKSSGESLLTLINDILDFSKIEAGKMDLETINFDLRTSVEGAMELLAFRAMEKNLEIATLIHSQVPNWLRGDPGRVRQIIINLVGNAIKFTEIGEVVLTILLVNETDSKVVLRFEIKDTGIGISKEGQSRLFKSFSQVDSSTTRKFGGTGLGLAISKKLSEIMHGEIGIESEEGKGATFWFTAQFEKQTSVENTTLQKYHFPELNKRRILVVDSNSTSLDIFHHYLDNWKCICACISEPKEAIELLKTKSQTKESFEVIIINMQLIGMNGPQLATLIKSDGQLNNTKIIMITDIGKRGDAGKMKKIGVEGYLTKPLKQSQLADCIQMVVSKNYAKLKNDREKDLITKHTIAEKNNSKKLKILLVEDNIVNQKVATKLIEKAGYSCDLATDGMEAVDVQCQKHYDLIFMDCQMPILSGYDATRAIREEESKEDNNSRVPIIAMTANAMKGDKEKCFEAGMDDYISKPINIETILNKLEKWSQPNIRYKQT